MRQSAGTSRALRNACLRYVTAREPTSSAQPRRCALSLRHQHDRHDRGARRALRMDWPERETAFAHFHDRFANRPAGARQMDGACRPFAAADHDRSGTRPDGHPAFDMKNPNRVRALIGAFSQSPALQRSRRRRLRAGRRSDPRAGFDQSAGGGTHGVRFENWRRYDEKRQALMRAELESILKQPGLSTNLFEVTTKMLG